MNLYHKIDSVFLRDPKNRHKTFLPGQWSRPEFDYLKDLSWVWTEKIDGTNIRVHWDGASVVRFGGRTDNAQIPTFLFKVLQDTFTEEKMRTVFPDPCMVTLYGEGYGAKIQKGGENYRADVGFILFDVYCGMWLERMAVVDIARKLDIPFVPVVGTGSLLDAISLAEHGFRSEVAATPMTVAEGLVMRPRVELLDRRGRRIITKVKTKDFSSP